jgi:hypothetical protein
MAELESPAFSQKIISERSASVGSISLIPDDQYTADLQAPGAAFIEAVCADLVATVIGITAAALIIRP